MNIRITGNNNHVNAAQKSEGMRSEHKGLSASFKSFLEALEDAFEKDDIEGLERLLRVGEQRQLM